MLLPSGSLKIILLVISVSLACYPCPGESKLVFEVFDNIRQSSAAQESVKNDDSPNSPFKRVLHITGSDFSSQWKVSREMSSMIGRKLISEDKMQIQIVFKSQRSRGGTLIVFEEKRKLSFGMSWMEVKVQENYLAVLMLDDDKMTFEEVFAFDFSKNYWHEVVVSLDLLKEEIGLFVNCTQVYQPRRLSRPLLRLKKENVLIISLGQKQGFISSFEGYIAQTKIGFTESARQFSQENCILKDNGIEVVSGISRQEEMTLQLQLSQLQQKLEKMESRLLQLEGCKCTRVCLHSGSEYYIGSVWNSTSTCETCSCEQSGLRCGPISCPLLQCKNPISKAGQCCSQCPNTCYFQGMRLQHGESLDKKCVSCLCHDGRVQCKRHVCPILDCPVYRQVMSKTNECCRVCQVPDYCKSSATCPTNSQCISTTNGFLCFCNKGFRPDRALNATRCDDIDECNSPSSNKPPQQLPPPPQSSAAALPAVPAPAPAIALGKHQLRHVPPVALCPDPKVCENTEGSYNCICPNGYELNRTTDQCVAMCSKPCLNGGRCQAPDFCSCPSGFYGRYCELDVNECKLGIHQCSNVSHCVNLPGSYMCQCNSGYKSINKYSVDWSGELCSDIDECSPGGMGREFTCNPSMQCVNEIPGYSCQCSASSPNCYKTCFVYVVNKFNVYDEGGPYTSSANPCHKCYCQAGRMNCTQISCDECNSNRVSSSSECCSHCPNQQSSLSESCVISTPSSSLSSTSSFFSSFSTSSKNQLHHFRQGDKWIDECQLCECQSLLGKVCRPLPCPELQCDQTITLPGHCCPMCKDKISSCSSPSPSSLLIENGSSSSCQFGNGQQLLHSQNWTIPEMPCIKCSCRNGNLCCLQVELCSNKAIQLEDFLLSLEFK